MRGARSGREITLPLEFFEWTACCICSPPNRVRPPTRAWYHNLVANPEVTVEHGTRRSARVARQLEADERDRMWRRWSSCKPRFAEYEQKTDRAIPVFALDRV